MRGIVLLLLYISTAYGDKYDCPYVDDLMNCTCFTKTKTIECNNATNLPNLSVKGDYNIIIFKNLDITEIKANLHGSTFKQIIIENNSHLNILPDFIFTKNLETLIIRNNSELVINLNSNFSDLTSIVHITIENNKLIREIGDQTFNSKKLKYISLQNNKIESITGGAFSGLQELREIRLDNNNITLLGDSCFDTNSSSIDIYLNYNGMLSVDYLDGIINITKTIVNLYLEYININEFPQRIFLPLLMANEENTIYLTGNNFNCTCGNEILWLLDKRFRHLSRQIIHLECDNDAKKDIFSFTKKDVCGVITTSTTLEPSAPTEQNTREEQEISSTTTTTEPNAPTEQNNREEQKSSSTTTTTEPSAPSEQNNREEQKSSSTTTITEPSAPSEQNNRTETTPKKT